MVGVVMYFCENRSIIMGHHSPLEALAQPSPTCKGKSLRCLRKCRFPYIDTSPALSRHLTAALHLGCQTHQTWCAPRHFGAVPSLIDRLFSAPNSKRFARNYGCNRRSHLGAWHAPGRRLEPNARLCVAVAQVVLRSKVKAVAL
jgi:hypothetical protein